MEQLATVSLFELRSANVFYANQIIENCRIGQWSGDDYQYCVMQRYFGSSRVMFAFVEQKKNHIMIILC